MQPFAELSGRVRVQDSPARTLQPRSDEPRPLLQDVRVAGRPPSRATWGHAPAVAHAPVHAAPARRPLAPRVRGPPVARARGGVRPRVVTEAGECVPPRGHPGPIFRQVHALGRLPGLDVVPRLGLGPAPAR